MTRLHWGLACSCLLGACFTPESGDETGSTETDASTGSPTSADGSTSLDSTAGPGPDATGTDAETSVTASGTSSPSETGTVACTDTTDCDEGLFCIDGSCGPCTAADDGDALCAAESPDLPVCDPDSMQCAACTAAMCGDQTPVCDAAAGCIPCTEHAQCPDSACHLMGPEAGGCFDAADVVEISDLQELENELGQMGNGDQRVLRLSGETYTFSATPQISGEVAILGQPGTIFTGGATNLMVVDAGAYLYVAGLEIADGPFRALNCVSGAGLWIDDTTISGYPVGVQASCETHVRRSGIRAPNPEGFAITASAALFLENSSIGPSPGTGLELGDVPVDLRFVTIAGNDTSITCSSNTSGEVRNSIIVGAAEGSISSGCFMLFVDNAVDTFGFGQQVGALDPSWFVEANAGDFHLAGAGENEFDSIADWDEGDPATDIDGDPRPVDMAGFPGIDEP